METNETIERQGDAMGQTGSHVSNEKEIFYGVHIPNFNDDQFLHVYTDKTEALKIVKHHKKARFKTFKSRSEAVNFAMNGSEASFVSDDGNSGTTPSTVVTDAEKPSPFKGPRSQDLVQFRRAIESGNLKLVFKTIWDNPRYLVSSGDTPSILQEGSRYNALHVAAKSKDAAMADLILQTIGDPAFCGLLYGEVKQDANVERAAVLLDLYINTPDKGMHETPLHFAAKFGAAQVVAILVSYAQCDRQRKNKFGQMPVDIICARCSAGNEEVKKEIQHLLEDEYYVPVLRAEDHCVQPSLGVPFSPKNPPIIKDDPKSPRLEIHAFAGPMNKTQAEKFRREWKKPPQSSEVSQKFLGKRKVRDPEKGLERSGRDLAVQYNVQWKEYWPFLNTFIDLASQEGLDLLEKFFCERFQSLENKIPNDGKYDPVSQFENTDSSGEILRVNQSLDCSDLEPEILSPVTQLCSMMKACTIMDDSLGSGQGRGSPSSLSSSSTTSNGSILSSSSARFFDWLNRRRPAVEKNVPADSQNEAILAALSQPALSPFLYVERSLQLFAKRIAASVHHIVSGSVNHHLTDSIRDVLKPEIKRVQGLVSSYMEDARFVTVDYHLVHSRIASSVAERLVAQLTSEEREVFYSNLQDMLSTRGHLDGTLSSDEEEYVPSTSTPYRQSRLPRQTGSSNQKAAIRCIVSQMVWALDLLQGSGPDGRSPPPLRPLVRSESECLEMWSDAYRCSCTWLSQNQSNFSRNSQKSSSMKRSFNNSVNVEGISRRLFHSQEENVTSEDLNQPPVLQNLRASDGEGDNFFTPPSSPPPQGDLPESDEEMCDPEEGPSVFVEGNEPTHVDVEVFEAIRKCDITPSSYPHIYRWRHGVLLYSSAERKRWRMRPVFRIESSFGTPGGSMDASVLSNQSEQSLNTTPLWSRVTGALSPRPSRVKTDSIWLSSPVF